MQPSRFEGHCVTVLEARLLAVPILATQNAAKEQLEDGKTGRLCKLDAASIADAAAELYRTPDLRQALREALRRLEQEHLIADTGKGSVVLGITSEDLVDIMDIRCKIEGLASYYAAKNATPEGLERLRHIMDLQEFYFEKRDAEHLREPHAAVRGG